MFKGKKKSIFRFVFHMGKMLPTTTTKLPKWTTIEKLILKYDYISAVLHR